MLSGSTLKGAIALTQCSSRGLLERLATPLGRNVAAEELFPYAYAMLANPGYVARFWEEMETPGPRLSITKRVDLFARGVDLRRRLIWLHTYGERMVPPREIHSRVPQGTTRCISPVPEGADNYRRT
jgi:predicted helicase